MKKYKWWRQIIFCKIIYNDDYVDDDDDDYDCLECLLNSHFHCINIILKIY